MNLLTAKSLLNDAAFPPLPYHDSYWTDNVPELTALIAQCGAKTAIEVGCWTGHTTAALAELVPDVIAVDAWAPFVDGISQFPMSMEQAYQQFLSNMVYRGVGDRVRVFRGTSHDAWPHIPNADIIFIDAAHDEQSVYMDCLMWSDKVNPRGHLCGDDWFIPGVRAAVEKFAHYYHFRVVPPGPTKDHGAGTLFCGPNRYKPTFWYLTR